MLETPETNNHFLVVKIIKIFGPKQTSYVLPYLSYCIRIQIDGTNNLVQIFLNKNQKKKKKQKKLDEYLWISTGMSAENTQ